MSGSIKGTLARLAVSLTCLLLALTHSFAAAPCDLPGLVSWWAGERNAWDATGRNPGTLRNGATFVAGEIGQAFQFNGNGSSYLEAGTTGFPTGTADRTVEFWVQIDTYQPGEEATFLGYGRFGTEREVFDIGAAADHRLFVSQWGNAIFGPALGTGTWYHVAATTENSIFSLYLNGARVGQQGMAFSTPAGSSFVVGRIPGNLGTGRRLKGKVDEIGVYNRALSGQEVLAIYRAGGTRKCLLPTFAAVPLTVTVGIGGSTTFDSRVLSLEPMTFQWQKDGIDLTGATNAKLSLANIQLRDAGDYTLFASGTLGSVTGVVARLSAVPLLIKTQPQSQIMVVGQETTFTVGACCGSLRYQWQFNGVAVAGASNSTLTVTNLQFAHSGDYTAVIANALSSTTSAVARLEVLDHLVHYVALTSTNPVPPYLSWATAATNIQDAVDAVSLPESVVLVTNGVYQSGTATAVVKAYKTVTMQSVNGAAVTVIDGGGRIPCLRLGSGATVTGFTVTHGYSDQPGGGVEGGTLNNCAITANSAGVGGGVYQANLNGCTVTGNSATGSGGAAGLSTLYNCILTGNSARTGGGAYASTLNNCTVTGNSATIYGGGAYASTLNNCIVYYNTAQQDGANYFEGTINYTCTFPFPPDGVGNISADPQLASLSRLSAGSPCRGTGSAVHATGLDIDGEPWGDPPSMGCDDYQAEGLSGELIVAIGASYTTVASGFSVDFRASIEGRVTGSVWDFGDGTIVSNRPYASHAWSLPGEYNVVLRAYNESFPEGRITTLRVHVLDAPVHYVSLESPNPVAPYLSWETAARQIQEAVDAAYPKATVLVSNGVYATGLRPTWESGVGVSNRVVVDKALTLRSVNGPQVTSIVGDLAPGMPNGGNGVRCVYLSTGTALEGFTLANGSAGGVLCESTNATIYHCTLTGNSGRGVIGGTLNSCTIRDNSGGGAADSTLNDCVIAGNSVINAGGGAASCTLNRCTVIGNSSVDNGGGVIRSTLNNCILTGNSASYGGGALYSTLNNCTVTGNSATRGAGGAVLSTLNNCILYYNTSGYGGSYGNHDRTTFNHTCTTPLPTEGVGNISGEPQLASASHLSAGSPCRGAGRAESAFGFDIDGEPWATPPSMGCDEYRVGTLAGDLSPAIEVTGTNVAPGAVLNFRASIDGRLTQSRWEFGDGTGVTNRPYASHAWRVAGDYTVLLWAYNESHPDGVSATVRVHVADPIVQVGQTHYVSVGSLTPVAPYLSWATAATRIQDAVDVAASRDLVLVSNGVYQVGERVAEGSQPNRVAVTNALTVRSVNGPEVTVIQGASLPDETDWEGATRCVYLAEGGMLAGFTLRNGATRSSAGYDFDTAGGGVYCVSSNSVVSNCVITANAAYNGGGAWGGTLHNCLITGNSATGYGGAVGLSRLNNCVITRNSVLASDGTGGGAYVSTLNNCTLTANSAAYGGGTSDGTLNNCIVYYNHGSGKTANYSGGTFSHSCTTPLPLNGVGNIDGEPLLASEFRIIARSPCRASGSASYATGVDMDGEPWAEPPSMGADEYHEEALVGPLTVAIDVDYTQANIGFPLPFQAHIDGRLSDTLWDWGDGTVVTNHPYASHAYAAVGDYTVVLRAYNRDHQDGVSASITVHVVQPSIRYVDAQSANPVAPYLSWETAAAQIQDAVDAALPMDLVLVTNGVYLTGERAVRGSMNRVAVTKPLALRSVNGADVTVLDGDGCVRCAYLEEGASLEGFTLTRGAADFGGGVWCASTNVTVSHCLITENQAWNRSGGGSESGTLNGCLITGNHAGWGGGVSGGVLNDCTISDNVSQSIGGGALECILNNCTIARNSAEDEGGGASDCILNNCKLTYNGTDSDEELGGGGAVRSVLSGCTVEGNSHSGVVFCVLHDCTLRGNWGESWAGGASWCTLDNCTITGNWSGNHGGGAYQSTLRNCFISGNSAEYTGGGAYRSTLINCTIIRNSGLAAGGVAECALTNCLVSYNSAFTSPNHLDSTFGYSCTTPLPLGPGNISADPQLAGESHLSGVSPCRSSGNAAYTSGLDIDGEPWANPPSMGCDDYQVGSLSGPLSLAINLDHTKVASGFLLDLGASIEGRVIESRWDFGDGTVVSNQLHTSHSWAVPGEYDVRLRADNQSFPQGVETSIRVTVIQRPILYVDASSANPVGPYRSWSTAAARIQDAVDAVDVAGSLVLVTNGVYQAGETMVAVVDGLGPNYRVAVTKPLTLLSMEGPEVTVIDGGPLVPCVWLGDHATLAGFTLTHGITAVDCQSESAVVSNCVITANSGIGAFRGTLNDCVFRGPASAAALNSRLSHCTVFDASVRRSALDSCTIIGGAASDWCALSDCTVRGSPGPGASFYCTLNNCLITGSAGVGVQDGTLNNCTVSGNHGDGVSSSRLDHCLITGNSGVGVVSGTATNCTVSGNGKGGAVSSSLRNCLITGNSAEQGGGALLSTLINCTVIGNVGLFYGGGVSGCALTNSLVYYNSARSGPNHAASSFGYSCTTPLPPGPGNISLDPELVNGTRLLDTSPCAASGSAAYASGVDIDGEPWRNPPSMGADQVTLRTSPGDLQLILMGGNTHTAIGSTLTLSAEATGTPPLRFQWRQNGALIPDATNATYTIDNAQIVDGGTYTVVVANETGNLTSDPILVVVEVPTTPSADNFIDRVLIGGFSGSVSGTNAWATREPGEPFHANKFGTNSVWYRWRAPANGIVLFRTVGSTFDTLLAVYTGTRVDALTLVAQDEDRGGFLTSELRFNAKAGVDYAIAIDGFAGDVGTFILTWDLEVTPEVLPVITAQPVSQTVTAGSDVPLSVTAAGVGLTYQWRVNGQAIAGANAASLTLRGVRPSDVGSYTVAITNAVGRGIVSLPASVEIGPEPGVHAQDKLEDLFVELKPPAPRLAGFSPVFLPLTMGTIASHIASTVEATTQSWEPSHCGSIGGSSVWFEFLAETNGRVVIDTVGSTFDTVVAVYRKVGIRDLRKNELACNTDFRQGNAWSQVVFDAEAGQGYWLVVDGANPGDVSGRVHLNYAMGKPPRAEVTPAFSVVHPGETRRLEARGVEGLPTPEYQWLKNGAPVVGATNNWFEVSERTYEDAGLYTVVIRNAVGELQQIVESVTTPWYTGEARPAEGKYRIHLFPVPTREGVLVLEQSTDLATWGEVYRHTDTINPHDVDVPLATAAGRFFRVRLELPGSP